jgi:hypothetical protein
MIAGLSAPQKWGFKPKIRSQFDKGGSGGKDLGRRGWNKKLLALVIEQGR